MTKNTRYALIAAALIVLIGAAAYFLTQTPQTDDTQAAVAASATATAEASEGQAEPMMDYDAKTAEPWVVEAMRNRSIGKDSAPITMYDFSSLSCPHCADFHANILPQLKKDYIDTGKMKLVFIDFPLNLPALQATALSRCIKDDEAYFGFIDQLFRTQKDWAMTDNAKASLIGTIKFTGLSREDAERCIDNQQLTAGILAQLDEMKNKYQIDSTPTFVLNDGKATVKGAETYDHFKAAIDPLVK